MLLHTDIDAIHKVKERLDRDLSIHYSLHDLSWYAGMNRNKLSQGFRMVFGITLKAYVCEQRLTRAKVQLIETELPLKQISKSAGYRYPSNFCTAFKKAFGVSAGELRKIG